MHVPEDPWSMQSLCMWGKYFASQVQTYTDAIKLFLLSVYDGLAYANNRTVYVLKFNSHAIDETVRTRLPGHFNLWM